jgi:hypothetical protein
VAFVKRTVVTVTGTAGGGPCIGGCLSPHEEITKPPPIKKDNKE